MDLKTTISTLAIIGLAAAALGCGDAGDAEWLDDTDDAETIQQELDEYLTWRGHYIGAWDNVQEEYDDDVKMVDAPKSKGKAIRFRVTPTSKPIDKGRPRERAEVAKSKIERPGTAVEYRWRTYFPQKFKPTPNTAHGTFTQFHHVPFPGDNVASGQANVSFLVDSRFGQERLKVVVRSGNINNPQVKTWDLGKLRRSQWYNFSVRVKWSADKRKGFFRVRVNGEPKVPWHKRATLYSGNPGVKLKQGYYRHHANFTTILYHDSMRRYALR